ncbi:hypothetical protein SAMN05421504_1173 [Amycolatopsis xylanica]|uniref:Transcription factor zinc-finger domain-containing protein n=2 Tax=Amycolatopsis xylanica TaxID=589385 RepID=A0A1H3T2E3_9PSEU|nr:hypothetical protein SAMN05421504_1173 [Amycolatopsis xylanica]
MRTVSKSGVAIEQCEGCRGIFLDRGELEQIAGAEASYYGNQPPAYQPPPTQHYQQPGGYYADSPKGYRGGHGYPDSPKGYRGGHGYPDSPKGYRGGHGGHKRRKSFLEELFD